MQKYKNLLKLIIKLTVSVLCLWYVSYKINWLQTWRTFKQSDWLWLFVAVVLFVASKIVASFRLNIYFRNINVKLSEKKNLELYWLGMFYNIFLPGGIGGDAYKVILLNKRYQYPAKLLTAAVLLDRVSGVVGISILSAVYYYFVFNGGNYAVWLLLAGVPAMIVYYFVVKKFFPSFISSFWSTFWLGVTVQALQVVAVYCIMAALHLRLHGTEYILIFLVSSLVAVLPFTIGGLGAREVVFIWGSKHFLLDQSQSVTISLLFYLISVLISLIGMYWVYNDPLKKEDSGLLSSKTVMEG